MVDEEEARRIKFSLHRLAMQEDPYLALIGYPPHMGFRRSRPADG